MESIVCLRYYTISNHIWYIYIIFYFSSFMHNQGRLACHAEMAVWKPKLYITNRTIPVILESIIAAFVLLNRPNRQYFEQIMYGVIRHPKRV